MEENILHYRTRTKKVIDVAYSDIFYIEAGHYSHQILLQKQSDMISFYGSLTELDKLSACLLRIHRDTLVNIDKIQCYLKKEAKIILIDGTALPVSRTGEKILAKQLTDNKYAF